METAGVNTPVKIQLKALSAAAILGTGCTLMEGAASVSGFASACPPLPYTLFLTLALNSV